MKDQRRSSRRRVPASAAVLAGAVVVVCAAWGAGAAGGGWLGRALRDPLTIRAGAAALASALVLYLLVAAMRRLGRARRAAGGEEGTAAIEFVLLLPIALAIVLIMIQSLLVVTGNVAVHYSAYAAARAATVWVPEKVSYEEPRNVVSDPEYSAKFHRIRCAAAEAVKAVSAGKSGAGGATDTGAGLLVTEGLDRFFSLYEKRTPRWVHTMLQAKCNYAWHFTEVTLVPPADGERYEDHEDLTVFVRHMLYLSVPYANRFFGDPLPGGDGDYATEATARYTLTNQGVEDEIDVEVFPRYVGRGEE